MVPDSRPYGLTPQRENRREKNDLLRKFHISHKRSHSHSMRQCNYTYLRNTRSRPQGVPVDNNVCLSHEAMIIPFRLSVFYFFLPFPLVARIPIIDNDMN